MKNSHFANNHIAFLPPLTQCKSGKHPISKKPKDLSINLKHTVNVRHFYLRCKISFHSVVKTKADWTVYSSSCV